MTFKVGDRVAASMDIRHLRLKEGDRGTVVGISGGYIDINFDYMYEGSDMWYRAKSRIHDYGVPAWRFNTSAVRPLKECMFDVQDRR